MRIAMCSLHVTDPAHAFRFYTDVLGFETRLTLPEHDVYIVGSPGQDVQLMLEPSDDVARAYASALHASGIPVIVLGTTTLDADVERLTEQGVRLLGSIFTDASGRAINVDDSVGNIIQLHEAAE